MSGIKQGLFTKEERPTLKDGKQLIRRGKETCPMSGLRKNFYPRMSIRGTARPGGETKNHWGGKKVWGGEGRGRERGCVDPPKSLYISNSTTTAVKKLSGAVFF